MTAVVVRPTARGRRRLPNGRSGNRMRMQPTLATRLRTLREQRGLNLTQAAKEIGVARTAYRLWELGAAAPAPEHWKDVALWCQVPLATLLLDLGLIDAEEERALLDLVERRRADLRPRAVGGDADR